MAQYEKLINLSLLSEFLTKAKTIFAPKITASGILKGNGSGGVSAATAGTDYATPTQVNAKYTKPSGGIPLTDLASQGTTNAGKFVVVGSDGKLTIAAINSAGGVSF